MEKEELQEHKIQEHKRDAIALLDELKKDLLITKSDLAFSNSEIRTLTLRMSELDSLNKKLREHILLRDSVERAMHQEYKAQLAQKEQLIRKLETGFPASGTAKLQDRMLTQKEEQFSQLQKSQSEKEEAYERVQAELTSQLKQRSAEIQRLNSIVQTWQKRNSQMPESQGIPEHASESGEHTIFSRENELLRHKLAEKETELKRLHRHYTEKEKAYDDIRLQLHSHVEEKTAEIERLKKFISEREELSQNIEEQLQKEVAEREAEIQELKQAKSYGRSLQLEQQLEQARQIIKLKDAAAKKLFLEGTKLKETNRLLEKKTSDQRAYSEGIKQQYETLIATIKKDNEKSVRGLIADYSEREASLRTETEKLKAALSRKESELEIQKQKIDAAIKEFSIRSQHIMTIRGTPSPEKGTEQPNQQLTSQEAKETTQTIPETQETQAPERPQADERKTREAFNNREIQLNRKATELAEKESETNAILATVEQNIRDLESREASLSLKEQILLRQQEAFNIQLQALKGGMTESGLETAMAAIKQAAKEQPMPKEAKSELAEPENYAKLPKAEAQKTVSYTELQKQQQPQQPPAGKPKKADAQQEKKIIPDPGLNLHEQTLGHPETTEIKSMIDIALQHGDTLEQIRQSLAASGYQKEPIEAAIKEMGL